MSELTFAELQREARRFAPRYDPTIYGACPSCGLGPTMAATLQGITWSLCSFCGLHWAAGTGMFDRTDESIELLGDLFRLIAAFDAADDDHATQRTAAKGRIRMMPTTDEPIMIKGRPETWKDAALRGAARERAQLEEQLGVRSTPLSDEQRTAYAETLRIEGFEERTRREALALHFGQRWPHWIYPNPDCPGETLSAWGVADRIRAGAPFSTYYRLQALGEHRSLRSRVDPWLSPGDDRV